MFTQFNIDSPPNGSNSQRIKLPTDQTPNGSNSQRIKLPADQTPSGSNSQRIKLPADQPAQTLQRLMLDQATEWILTNEFTCDTNLRYDAKHQSWRVDRMDGISRGLVNVGTLDPEDDAAQKWLLTFGIQVPTQAVWVEYTSPSPELVRHAMLLCPNEYDSYDVYNYIDDGCDWDYNTRYFSKVGRALPIGANQIRDP